MLWYCSCRLMTDDDDDDCCCVVSSSSIVLLVLLLLPATRQRHHLLLLSLSPPPSHTPANSNYRRDINTSILWVGAYSTYLIISMDIWCFWDDDGAKLIWKPNKQLTTNTQLSVVVLSTINTIITVPITSVGGTTRHHHASTTLTYLSK